MPLHTRKLFFLFCLCFISIGSLKSQIGPGLPIGVISLIINKNKKVPTVKLFRSYKFDTSSAITGIDFTDATNGRKGQLSFYIDNKEDLEDLKKNWSFSEAADKSDTGIFKVFFTKNKVIMSSWVIFPKTSSIVTTEGLYHFDSVLLLSLHQQYPLVYSTRTDTLKGKSEYLRFYDSVKTAPAFLFLMEPDIVCEGSFEVTLKVGSTLTEDETGERIINICNKTKQGTAYRVYLKLNDDNGDPKRKTYIVKCDRLLFEQFADRKLEKANWAPAVYTIKSFWRSL